MKAASADRKNPTIGGLPPAVAGFPAAAPRYAGPVDSFAGQSLQQFPATIPPPANAPWGPNGYPGDTVDGQSSTGVLNLTPGTSAQKLNPVAWTIDYTYGGTVTEPHAWTDLTFDFTVARGMAIDGGATVMLSPTGHLNATWDNDFLTFDARAPVVFDVQGYRVQVTPLGLDFPVAGSDFSGNHPWGQPGFDLQAQFEVTAVPDSCGTFAMLGAALVGVAALRRRFFRA